MEKLKFARGNVFSLGKGIYGVAITAKKAIVFYPLTDGKRSYEIKVISLERYEKSENWTIRKGKLPKNIRMAVKAVKKAVIR